MLDFDLYAKFDKQKTELFEEMRKKNHEKVFTISYKMLIDYYDIHELKENIQKVSEIHIKSLEKMLKGVI